MAISQIIIEGFNHAINLNFETKGSKLKHLTKFISPTFREDLGIENIQGLYKLEIPYGSNPLINSTWGDLIDKEDQLNFLHDPSSAYALNAGYALGRKMDDRIIKALFYDNSNNNIGDPLINCKIIEAQAPVINDELETKISAIRQCDLLPHVKQELLETYYSQRTSNYTGITIEKIIEARDYICEEDQNCEQVYLILTSPQISCLLRNTKDTSPYYKDLCKLLSGEVDEIVGVKVKRVASSMLPKDKDGMSYCILFSNNSISSSHTKLKGELSIRSDKAMAIQVIASFFCGALRTNDAVVAIQCLEVK